MSGTMGPMGYVHEIPEPKPSTEPVTEDMGKHWCPECDCELVESGGAWHHIFGERYGCGWTD